MHDLVKGFNSLLIKELKGRLSGEHEEYESFSGDWPSDMFPAGNLCPQNLAESAVKESELADQEGIDDVPQFMRSDYRPSSMGVAVYLKEDLNGLKAQINGQFVLFERTSPPRAHLESEIIARFGPKPEADASVPFPRSFKRRILKFNAVAIPSNHTDDFTEIEPSMVFPSDDGFKASGTGELMVRRDVATSHSIRQADVRTDEDYVRFIASSSTTISQKWALRLLVRLKNLENGVKRLDVFLINSTTAPKKRKDWLFDPFLFAPEMRVEFSDDRFSSVPLPELTETDYRYSTTVSCTGRNCHARLITETKTVFTETIPVYEQAAITWPLRKGIDESDLEFQRLANSDPRPILRKITSAMNQYYSTWESNVVDYAGSPITSQSKEISSAIESAKRSFKEEIERFENGIRMLEDESIKLAFELTNSSFAARFKGHSGWRLFQLVFVVSHLPSIAMREKPGMDLETLHQPATVLWLPTGSGKTEAFTALVILHAFFDRLRGKDGGVTAWAKYPLRFLSMQQVERAVISIEAANRILRSNMDRIKRIRVKKDLQSTSFDEFSVGYFVGSTTTPNNLTKADDFSGMTPLEEIERNKEKARQWQIITKCPNCMLENNTAGNVSLTADKEQLRLYHSCSVCGKSAPLAVTDTEVYARLPTFLISTIDKGAVFGRVPESQTILGLVRAKCTLHGYYNFRGKCCTNGSRERCKGRITDFTIYDGCPGIIIQDEMHLLDESLGALAAQYETFQQQMAKNIARLPGIKGKPGWKIIASTATIADFRKHIQSLYMKDSYMFPVKGPSAFDCFYYGKDKNEKQRLVLGISAHNMTHPNTVVKILQFFHAFSKQFETDPNKFKAKYPELFGKLNPKNSRMLIALIRTSLMYGIVKSETYQKSNCSQLC